MPLRDLLNKKHAIEADAAAARAPTPRVADRAPRLSIHPPGPLQLEDPRFSIFRNPSHTDDRLAALRSPGHASGPDDPRFTIFRPDTSTAEPLDLPASPASPPLDHAPGPTSPPEAKRSRWRRASTRKRHPPPADGPAPSPHAEQAPRAPGVRSPGGAAYPHPPLSAGVYQQPPLSASSTASTAGSKSPRLSALFRGRSGSRGSRSPSPSLPDELDVDDGDPVDMEAAWEKRATVLGLAQGGTGAEAAGREQEKGREKAGSRSLEIPGPAGGAPWPGQGQGPTPGRPRAVSDAKSDDDIQKAIQLHEDGFLADSTAMFGRLADPAGPNHALSQVLYGLALQHGWGIAASPSAGVSYLSLAARNAAAIEAAALDLGHKHGGAAKGELVLAIYELANCYRAGSGVAKDLVAARRFFETAAHLGDVDALEQVARCYEDGIGGKKDRRKAARYYRQAEARGHKIVGNSWIWKAKYDEEGDKGKEREREKEEKDGGWRDG